MSKSLFIIGAGPGIALATAEKFGREGWTIIAGARNAARLDGFVGELRAAGVTVHAVPVDATDPTSLRAAMRLADELARGLGAVLFNAAVVRQQDLFSMTDAEVESDLSINVAGGLHSIRAAAELFGTRGGTILVTGGGLGVTPHAGWASLGLGKAALRNLVQGLAEPMAERNIRIAIATVATLVAPGSAEASGVADTFWDLANGPAGRWEATYPAA